MVTIELQDRQRLVQILQKLSEFEDERSRRSFLSVVGIDSLLPRLDLSGSPSIASAKVINFLVTHGHLTNGNEALGSLLSEIKPYLGVMDQIFIDEMLRKYRLMLPVARIDSNASVSESGGREISHPIEPEKSWASPPLGQSVPTGTRVQKVVISCSRDDSRWLESLKTHLAPLERQQAVDLWDDTRIAPGARREQAITDTLNAANIAILLVSKNFFAAQFIMHYELPSILRRCSQGQLTLLPLILSPCLYDQSPLGEYQVFNDFDGPLSELTSSERDKVFVRLAETISKLSGNL